MEELCGEKQERFINYLMGRLEKVGAMLQETAHINDESLLRFRGPQPKDDTEEKAQSPDSDKEKIERLLSGLDGISGYLNSQAQDISNII